MKKARIFWVGKTRARSVRDGLERYRRLISPWLDVELAEIREERGAPAGATAAAREGARILRRTERFILLDARGKAMSSEAFAGYLDRRMLEGPLDWVIGGAFGVSDEVRTRAYDTVSLSPLTLTHDIARLVLLEQIYRALTIIHGKKYHY